MSSSSLPATITDPPDDAIPFMLPGMPAPEHLNIDAGSRVVRFDRQCVLIPESTKPKRSLVVTRSYSLPLWKRKGHIPDFDAPEEPAARSPSPENTRVILKVPIPTFRRRSSRSPTRARSVSTSPTMPHLLTPCLVHREPSSSPEIPHKLPSRPSLPIYQRRQNDITVPLRECCQACERITEECLREGDLWTEKFSRGARRRRSVSLDQHQSLSKIAYSSLDIKASHCCKIHSRIATDDDIEPEPRCGILLTVDEVDKRRKSFDFAVCHAHRRHEGSLSPTSFIPFNSHDRDISSSSTSSQGHSDELIPDVLDSRHCLRASPIEEEDEAELFPLPRRTPSASPSPKASPSPSPNGSTSCLPSSSSAVGGLKPAACSSKESVASRESSSQESLLKASLTRKLSPHGAYSSSSKGSPLATTMRPLPPLPPLPRPLPDINSGSPSASLSPFPRITTPVDPSSINTSTSSKHPSTSSDAIATSLSSSPSSTSSPQSPPQKSLRRKTSFTKPFVKAGEVIKGVSADVLKGVNSMSVGSPF